MQESMDLHLCDSRLTKLKAGYYVSPVSARFREIFSSPLFSPIQEMKEPLSLPPSLRFLAIVNLCLSMHETQLQAGQFVCKYTNYLCQHSTKVSQQLKLMDVKINLIVSSFFCHKCLQTKVNGQLKINHQQKSIS